MDLPHPVQVQGFFGEYMPHAMAKCAATKWKSSDERRPSIEGEILETSLLGTEREMLLSLITLVCLLKLPRFLFLECVCLSQFPQRSCLLDRPAVLRISQQLWLPEQCLQKVKPAEHYR